jgi:hypothetical protein
MSFGSVILSFLPFVMIFGIFYWAVQAVAGRGKVLDRQAHALERIASALEDRKSA